MGDDEMNAPCKRCNGLGYIPVRGEAMAADLCGCTDWLFQPDTDEDEIDDADDRDDEPAEWQEWRDYDPEC
jgi:hypothetical protein